MKKISSKKLNTATSCKFLIEPVVKFARSICLLLIRFYQIYLSGFFGGHCRFDPSCSEYARQAFTEHRIDKALILSLHRLSRCHPWHSFGYDPVPKRSATKRNT